MANALETLGQREDNQALIDYSRKLKEALIETVAQGTITGDLKGKTTDPDSEPIVDMYGVGLSVPPAPPDGLVVGFVRVADAAKRHAQSVWKRSPRSRSFRS